MQLKKVFIHTLFTLLVLACLTTPASANTHENVFGFGFGLPYGGLGVNYECSFNDYLVPLVGIGTLPDNIGWNVGVRLYYPDREAQFRGRITALYGINTLLENRSSAGSDYETETGISAGIGVNWRFGRSWAFDADLFLVNSDVPAGYEEKGSDVKIALGFNYRW